MNNDDTRQEIEKAKAGDAGAREGLLGARYPGLDVNIINQWLADAIADKNGSLIFEIAGWFEDVKQDHGKYLEVLKIASDMGNEAASYWLGEAYREGLIVKVDFAKAHEFYRLAAKRGFEYRPSESSPLWGGDDRSERDLRQQFGDDWADFVIKRDELVDANFELQDHDILNGLYVNADHEELIRLERVAEEKNNHAELDRLHKEEVTLLKHVAQHKNDPLAKFRLAVLYLNGSLGVEKNLRVGKLLLLQARASGVRRASDFLVSYFPLRDSGVCGKCDDGSMMHRSNGSDWMFPNGHDDGEASDTGSFGG